VNAFWSIAVLTTPSELESDSMSGLFGASLSRSLAVSFDSSATHSSAMRTHTGEPGVADLTSASTCFSISGTLSPRTFVPTLPLTIVSL
jgi:hypothetical protein